MAQIIPQVGIAERLGSSLGTGLSSGLQALAQNKLQQLAQRTATQRWQQAVPNIPEGLAQLIGSSPEGVQKALLDRLEGLQFGAQPQNILQPQAPTQELQAMQQSTPQVTLGPSSAERRHRETLNQQAQQHIDKLATPYFKEIRESAVAPRKIISTAEQIRELVESGKAKTGIQGRFTPAWLQTPEGQELTAKLNDVVLLKAQLGKGVPTKMRLTLEELSKPAIWQQPKAILRLVDDLIKDPEFNKEVALDRALEEFQDQWQTIPKNYESLIKKRAHEISKSTLSGRSTAELEKKLPAKDYPGKVAVNPKTGQRMKSVDGKWVALGEE